MFKDQADFEALMYKPKFDYREIMNKRFLESLKDLPESDVQDVTARPEG